MTSQPIPNQDRLDMGNGVAATRYYDGSVVFWNIAPPNEQVAYLPPGGQNPADIGGGKAATFAPDGSIMVYDINNPPPEVAGAIPTGATPGAVPAQPAAPAGVNGVNNPISTAPGGYGSRGFLPSGEPRPNDLLMGTSDFGRGPNIPIMPNYVAPLKDPKLAPGYLEGSGSYNQFPLNQAGLFGPLPGSGSSEVVNLRYGLGGPGDPSNGSELQTPTKFAANSTGLLGDARWRREHGGGGGYLYQEGPSQGAGFRYPQAPIVNEMATFGGPRGVGGGGGDGGGGGGGMGGGAFEWSGNLTGQWAPLATMVGRPDSPPYGIATNAVSYPQAYYDLLRAAIQQGVVKVNPVGWQFLQETKGITPQGWGVNPASVAGTGGTGSGTAGGSTEDAIANANAAAAADKAAYWAYQQSLLRQGDQRIAMEAARDAWTQEYQKAGLTGKIGDQDTLEAQAQQAGFTGFFQGNPTLAREQWQDSTEYRDAQAALSQKLAEAGLLGTYEGQATLAKLAQEFQQAEMNRQFGLSEAGVTGTYNGAPTMAAVNQQNQTALSLMQLQSQLRGPRDWAAYQSTFNSTPQGLKDVVSAFQGRYALPGAAGANGQAQGGRATVAGLAGDLLSGTYQGAAGQQPETLTNPYQADVRNWSRMQPSQREMILGKYEQSGWFGDDFQNMLNSAAPKYAGAQGGNFNLFQG